MERHTGLNPEFPLEGKIVSADEVRDICKPSDEEAGLEFEVGNETVVNYFLTDFNNTFIVVYPFTNNLRVRLSPEMREFVIRSRPEPISLKGKRIKGTKTNEWSYVVFGADLDEENNQLVFRPYEVNLGGWSREIEKRAIKSVGATEQMVKLPEKVIVERLQAYGFRRAQVLGSKFKIVLEPVLRLSFIPEDPAR